MTDDIQDTAPAADEAQGTSTTVDEGIGNDPAPEDTAPDTQAQSTQDDGTKEEDEAGIGAEEEQGTSEAEAKYTVDGIELPDGMTFDDKTIDQLADVCKEAKFSPEAFRAIAQKMTPVLEARNAERIGEVRKQFLAQGRADAEMGGAKWADTKRNASQAFRKFVDPETRQLFVKLGLDCHPGVIRAFKRIQESVSDDVVIRGEPSAKRDPLANFYDNSDMN